MSGALALLPPETVLFGLAALVWLLPRRPGHAAAVAGALATSGWLLAVPAGAHLDTVLLGFEAVLFNVDVYARLLGLTFGVVAAVGVAYAFATGADRRQTASLLAYVGTGMGAVLAGDWLTLVIFWELMAVWATVLVWHTSGDRSAGIRYAIYHELGGLALAAGVLLHYADVGSFVYGGGITGGLPAVLVALGIGLNAGFLGLHVWLVDTYPRTHVATSVVFAAVTTKVGAYTILRAFPDGHLVLASVGGTMVLVGVALAILQTDLRRLLSYHIVSQVGYIVAGFGAGSGLATAGAMAHLVNNILYKSLLFMVAGVLIRRTGVESLKRLDGRGLGRAMPVTAGVFLVAALSISGIPGFNGFISKGMVLDGVEDAGLDLLWYALLLGGVGTVVSFLKVGYYAFGGGDGDPEVQDLGPVEGGALGSVAALCVLVGVLPALLFGLLPAEGVAEAKPFAVSQFLKAGGVAAAGIIVFLATRERLAAIRPVADLDRLYHPAGDRLRAATVATAGAVEDGIDGTGRWVTARLRPLLSRSGTAEQRLPWLPGLEEGTIGPGVLAIVVVLVILVTILLVA